MQALLEELAGTIIEEIAVQEKTLAKLEEQQRFVVEHAMEKLEKNLTELDAMLPSYQQLEEKRKSLGTQLARRLGMEDQATLKSIIEATLKQPERGSPRSELADLRNRLVGIAEKVRAKSKQNMILLRQAIELNHDLLQRVFKGRGERVSTYGQDGELVAAFGSGVVDRKV
ncbi:MAG: flagellar protein FlgN [Planctomycetes bacterium]|nr:flagellar protein FlgN [Planctomycetota bacterium]